MLKQYILQLESVSITYSKLVQDNQAGCDTAGDLGKPATAARLLTALQRELRQYDVAVDLPLVLAQLAALKEPVIRRRMAATDAASKLTHLQCLQLAGDDLIAADAASEVSKQISCIVLAFT